MAGIDCCSADSYGPAGLCKCLLTRGAFLMCQLRPKAELQRTKLQAHYSSSRKITRIFFWLSGAVLDVRCASLPDSLHGKCCVMDANSAHTPWWECLNAYFFDMAVLVWQWWMMGSMKRSNKDKCPDLDSHSCFLPWHWSTIHSKRKKDTAANRKAQLQNHTTQTIIGNHNRK